MRQRNCQLLGLRRQQASLDLLEAVAVDEVEEVLLQTIVDHLRQLM